MHSHHTHTHTRTQGTYVYTNGDTYEGGYYNGLKHGYGSAAWSNGSRYEGHWDSGREHGEGRYFAPTGQCYTGNFSQGFVDGEGVHTWGDGSSFHCVHSMGAAVSQGHYVAAITGTEEIEVEYSSKREIVQADLQLLLRPPQAHAVPQAQPQVQFSAAQSQVQFSPSQLQVQPQVYQTSTENLVQLPDGQIGYMIPVNPITNPAYSSQGPTSTSAPPLPHPTSPYASRTNGKEKEKDKDKKHRSLL